jgi:ketosteroid isomerase-like protein
MSLSHASHALTPERVQELVALFETLSPENLSALDRFYAPQAAFKDPFNDLVGREAIQALFVHMFETLEAPHFVVNDRLLDGSQVFLTWRFNFKVKGRPGWPMQTIEGSTYLRWSWDTEGAGGWLIDLHRDYWDAAQELYEKFPIIGWILRGLRKKLASPKR